MIGPACWLWDYLEDQGNGLFLAPLSGGADSSSVALWEQCAGLVSQVTQDETTG
jgi:hypothetical protein